MNAFDKSFIKAYVEPPETPPKLMSLSEAIELSRENSDLPEPDIEAIANEEPIVLELDAKETTADENRFDYPTDTNEDILPMPTPAFQPLLQVDALAWPKVCGSLEEAADDQLSIVADLILSRARGGQKMIGFMGAQSGSGCTTLLLTIAQCLAERCRVAIVDANRENPGLSRDLGLLPDVGLKDVAEGSVPLDEALIESLDDHLVLLPYSGHTEADYGHDMNISSADLRRISHHYDVVLIDLGSVEQPNVNLATGSDETLRQIDASLIVQDARKSGAKSAGRATDILRAASVDILGIVENRTNTGPTISQEQAFERYSNSLDVGTLSDAA